MREESIENFRRGRRAGVKAVLLITIQFIHLVFWCPFSHNTLRSGVFRSSAVVVHARLGSVVCVAIIVEVNLGSTFLKNGDDVVKRAQTVRINWTAWVRFRDRNHGVISREVQSVFAATARGKRDLHNESDLFGLVVCGAGQDLSGEMCREWNKLASNEAILMVVLNRV